MRTKSQEKLSDVGDFCYFFEKWAENAVISFILGQKSALEGQTFINRL
jgi:hypothetical protein